MADSTTFRIAAMSDIHYDKDSAGKLSETFAQASEETDVLLLCGDLTDFGYPAEAELLLRDLHDNVEIPILAVLGNHDFECGQVDDLCDVLHEGGIKLLEGECTEIGGVGFAGACGFGGGFGRWALSAFGEQQWKDTVQRALNEELKLEAALTRLNTEHRVVLLHYAPIRDTVVGEPEEIFPFLGSGRLAEPLDRFEVTAAFHGHAHLGAPEGKTRGGVPIYNVSIPVLERNYPDRPHYHLLELEVNGEDPANS